MKLLDNVLITTLMRHASKSHGDAVRIHWHSCNGYHKNDIFMRELKDKN